MLEWIQIAAPGKIRAKNGSSNALDRRDSVALHLTQGNDGSSKHHFGWEKCQREHFGFATKLQEHEFRHVPVVQWRLAAWPQKETGSLSEMKAGTKWGYLRFFAVSKEGNWKKTKFPLKTLSTSD